MINVWTRLLRRLAASQFRKAPRRGRHHGRRLPFGAQVLESRALLTANTTTALSPPAAVDYGSTTTLTAVVTDDDLGGSIVNSGTVSFLLFDAESSTWQTIGSDSLDDGSATLNINPLVGVGLYAVRAEYLGVTDTYGTSQDDDTLQVTPATLTVTADDASKTYDGVSFSGGNGVSYSGFVNGESEAVLNGALTYGGSSQGAVNAGDYEITPQGVTSDNYTIDFVTGSLTVAKADATISVTGYIVTYDGTAHTATGGATGVNGEDLAGLDLSGTTRTNAGSSTDGWTFTDVTGNYNDAAGTVDNTIAKADATILVTGYSVTYDGTAHTATGSATGVNGEDLVGLDLSGTTQTNAGTYTGSWAFTDVTGNYNDQDGVVSSEITRATLTVSATANNKTYDATNVAAVSLTDDRVAVDLEEGRLQFSYDSALFDGKSAGEGKTVTISGLSLSGESAGNYELAATVVTATANIDRKQITGSFTVSDKTYDSTTFATVLTRTANAVEADDDVEIVGGMAVFVSANVGTRSASLAGAYLSGVDSANYVLTSVNDANSEITPAVLTIDVAGYTGGAFDSQPHTQTVTITGVGSDGVLFTDSLTETGAGSHSQTWSYSNSNYTPDPATGTLAFTIDAREATAAYIGNTYFVTSGSSATTTQVTLSASLQDPTGLALEGATVDFFDVTGSTPKLLAGNVRVVAVDGNPSTGTASTTVTLSTGQHGATSYFIRTVVSGNYTNDSQPDSDRTVSVSVVQPVGVNTIKGAGTLSRLSSAVGTYAPSGDASFSVGVSFNKSLKNIQGQITLFLPQSDGSVVLIKSNALTSMTAANLSIGRVNTIYSKANITRLNSDGTSTSLEGNVTLRLDVTGNGPSAKVAFTVLSGSALRYSNNWSYDTTAKAWKTGFQDLFTGAVAVG